MKVLSVKFSKERKLEYSTRTEIVKLGDKQVVRKVAMTDKAVPFVNGMELNYQRMVENYGKEHVAEGWLDQDGVFCMEFVEGISMEQKAMNCFIQGDYDGFIDVISYYYTHILLGEMKEKADSSYINPLDADRRYNIDLILANIIVPADGRFKIIDYEWLFPTGSKEFTGARAMGNLNYNGIAWFDKAKMNIRDLCFGLGIEENRFEMLVRKENQFLATILASNNDAIKKRLIRVEL